jgi:methionine biosynthesis protein MetW
VENKFKNINQISTSYKIAPKYLKVKNNSRLNNLSKFDRLSTSFVPKNSRVLDLGCADGKIGLFMAKNLGCQVIGVEANPSLAQIASRRLTKVIIGDLENKKVQQEILKGQNFDIIFASAILEHLKQPQITIQQLKKSLRKSGKIIVTLPNIAYWSIRLNLLFGNFIYTKSGILDKTHLKFFTIKTALNFLEKDCSLKIVAVDYDFPDLPLITRMIKFSLGSNTQEKMFRLLPNLFAYQILVVAKPK